MSREEIASALHRRLEEEEVEYGSSLWDLCRALADDALAELPPAIDADHLDRQRQWSEMTFGPGARTHGVIDHIRKELVEIEQAPEDLREWVDVIILALDGAWRAGHEPQDIIDAVKAKQSVNEARQWPDWRRASESEAIEHVRG